MRVGLIAKKVFLFPFLVAVHTIKISLGLNGEDYDDGVYGGFYPQGLTYAFIGGIFISVFVAVGGWHVPSEERGGADTFIFVWLLFSTYLFVFSFFVFPMVRRYFQFHFPRGNWFYLPRRGRVTEP
jgi:hypothetical protein